MYNRSLALVVATLLVTSAAVAPVAAQSDRPSWSGEVFTQLEEGFGLYNDASGELDLGPLAGQIENKRVNLYVSDAGETAVYSFRITGDGAIVDLRESPHDDATLRMETDRATIEHIAAAESGDQAANRFTDAVRSDDIVPKGERGNVVAQITWGVLNALKGLLS
ncbi:hypothetical protein Hbl1158_06305 [Halobaculum sp. CBA1158]|uniref:hypothetical protein n=1 Tax=Halobaculum sp. CBA1158 TaxID=2904243 RepID=UPI001F1741B9|nr:hypothetical protein [Halobaculum sp. CBA1158]UIP00965.1 hypothetical protein Hbl1158_06305 [Halobaculum sp. CBA1158]